MASTPVFAATAAIRVEQVQITWYVPASSGGVVWSSFVTGVVDVDVDVANELYSKGWLVVVPPVKAATAASMALTSAADGNASHSSRTPSPAASWTMLPMGTLRESAPSAVVSIPMSSAPTRDVKSAGR